MNHPKFYTDPSVETYFRRQHGWITHDMAAGRPGQKRPAAVQRVADGRSPSPDASVSIALFGDLMWLRDPHPTTVSEAVRAFLHDADFTFGNLETVIDRRQPVSRSAPLRLFNSSPDLLRLFADARAVLPFTAFSFANNHTLDFGDAGARATVDFLDEVGVGHSGLEPDDAGRGYRLFKRNGVRVGFYAATYGANWQRDRETRLPLHVLPSLRANTPDEEIGPIERALGRMDEDGVQVRVVSLHWGHEYESYPDVKHTRLARRIVARGADVVLGHHPHIVQPMEMCVVNGYRTAVPSPRLPRCALTSTARGGLARKALICYSMGDFLTDKKTHVTRLGLLTRLRFFPAESGLWDWHVEANRLVYTRPEPPPAAPRKPRLVFVDDEAFVPDRTASPEIEKLIRYLARLVPLSYRSWSTAGQRRVQDA